MLNALYDCENWQGLSEQHILDCGSYSAFGDDAVTVPMPWYEFHGCNGGMQSNVYQWAYKNRGILAENAKGYRVVFKFCFLVKKSFEVIFGSKNVIYFEAERVILGFFVLKRSFF